MESFERSLDFETSGDGDIIDITGKLREALGDSGIRTGQLCAFVPGSTGALTTIEHEPGLLRDLPEFFDRVVPKGARYHHDATWGDGNGFSHVRAALVGPSVTVPVSGGEMTLGTWQQVVFLEFDNRPRRRRVVVSIVGGV